MYVGILKRLHISQMKYTECKICYGFNIPLFIFFTYLKREIK